MTTIDIILFCYKQEQYIEQALQSIYDQQVPADSSVRIIVADDCSPDNTLVLIEKHAAESPFPMVFLPKESNMGISKNYKRSFAATTADYVFILEGDDYWLPGHVKQHVDFLIAHPECSMSMNRICFYHEEINKFTGEWVYGFDVDYVTKTLKDQITNGNQLGNLSACAFGGNFLRKIPSDFYNIPVADWAIGFMMAENGDIALLRDNTSVYRYKSSGQWAGKSQREQKNALLECADMYDKFQKGKYHNWWLIYETSIIQNWERNWMYHLPQCIQNAWHKLKSWIKS